MRELTADQAAAVEKAARAGVAAREALAAYQAAVAVARASGATYARIGETLGTSAENVRKMVTRHHANTSA